MAHALLQSSDPAAGSTVASAPSIITLTFGEAPDPKLSSVRVLDATGKNVASGPAAAVPGRPDQLQVGLGTVPEGVYTVSWRTVSTVDGHTVIGSFAFGVGVSPGRAGSDSGAVAPTSSSASPAADVSRFLLYLGLIVLLGAGLAGTVLQRQPSRAIGWLAIGGWAVSAAGTIGVVTVEGLDAGADLATFLTSALGGGVVSRLLVSAATGVIVALLAVSGGVRRRWLFALAGAAAAAGMLTDVVNGHAAASGPTLLQIGLQWLHVLAVGVWLGGLVALLIGLRGAPSEDKALAARRFSRVAGFALVAVAATGLVRAIQEIGTIDGLLTTDYGRVVIAKSALLVLVGALGTFNHFVSVPAAVRTLRPLRRVGRVEVTVGAIALLATGLLVNLVPPASVAAAPSTPAAQPLTASGNDFGTTVRVRLVVSPGAAGINQFTLAVTDYDTGEPVSADAVSLRFEPASSSGVGGSSLPLAANGTGTFGASGGNLSLDGIWNVTAVVAAPAATVEVPLVLATNVPGVTVDANPVPGAPTIFIAHLAGGTTLQVYLDPGTAGPNELHATFFDSAGTELRVQTATYLVASAGGPAGIIVPRQLEPGHFVADLTADAGSLGADIAGPAPDGTMLHAHVDIPVQP